MKTFLKSLFFFSLFSLINKIHTVTITNNYQIYLYPDDKIKMKNVCAISGTQKKVRGSTTTISTYLYLKEKCGKKEKCVETQTGYYQCIKKTFLRKIGESCGINEECYTGLCYNTECSSIQNDEDCTAEYDSSNPEKVCNPGNWCYEYDSLNHYYKCVNYLNENEEYDSSDGKICRFGLAPLRDVYGKVVCQKYGTIEDGKECNNEGKLCVSGFCENDPDTNLKKCFSVTEDSDCEFDSGLGDYYCKPIVNGLKSNEVYRVTVKCDNTYNNVYVCPYTIGKMNVFKEFANKLSGINFDKVYKDEKKFHSFGLGNNDLSKAYQKYYYFDYLYAINILNYNGGINKKKEWEFFWKMNNTKYVGVHIIKVMIFFLLLYIY